MRLAVVLVGMLLAVAAAGCGGDSKNSAERTTVTTTVATTTTPTVTASATTRGKYEYPPVVVNNFMQSCQNGMSNRRAYCACTLDELSDRVSVARTWRRSGCRAASCLRGSAGDQAGRRANCADKL